MVMSTSQQDSQGCIPENAFTATMSVTLCNARLVDEPQSSYLFNLTDFNIADTHLGEGGGKKTPIET